ncbi:MAG: hypothetical protein ABIG96_05655 [Candidatus Micrarchaeota archaeon]
MQFKGHDLSSVGTLANQLDMAFADKELKLLLIWAIISPAAGVSYLIWLKYPKLRLLALLGFAIALIQFYSQMGTLQNSLRQVGIVL